MWEFAVGHILKKITQLPFSPKEETNIIIGYLIIELNKDRRSKIKIEFLSLTKSRITQQNMKKTQKVMVIKHGGYLIY